MKNAKTQFKSIIKTNLYKYNNGFLKEKQKLENDDTIKDEIYIYEIFDLIRIINDPEYPYNLEKLNITSLDDINVDNLNRIIKVYFTPTIDNCGFAHLIGLSIKKNY